MTKAAPLAIISSVTAIAACALFGASAARADGIVVTIAPSSVDTVTVSSDGGALNLDDLSPTTLGTVSAQPQMRSGTALLGIYRMASSGTTRFGPIFGPTNFGTLGTTVFANTSTLTPGGNQNAFPLQLEGNAVTAACAPCGTIDVFTNNNPAAPPAPIMFGGFTNIYGNQFTPQTFATLGLIPGVYRWTWGECANLPTCTNNESFTIDVVPGPIVGAGLPGLIFAGGGLLAWLRRRRTAVAAA